MGITPTLWVTLRNGCTRTRMGHSNLQQVLGLVGVTWQARERLLGSVGTGGMLSCWGWGSWGRGGDQRPAPSAPPGSPAPQPAALVPRPYLPESQKP